MARLWNVIQPNSNVFKSFKKVTKHPVVLLGSLYLEGMSDMVKINSLGEASMDQVSLGVMITPHGLKPEGLGLVS